jgi:hypothetical protein
LQGIEGILLEIRGRHRLVVSVELLRRSVAVELNPESTSVFPIGASAHQKHGRPALSLYV